MFVLEDADGRDSLIDVCVLQVMAVGPSIPGYTIQTLEWDVQVAPGRVEVLNGTIQEVFAQAVQINPDFKQLDVATSTPKRGMHENLKRTTVYCGTWPLADKGRIIEGIAYLRGVPAAPRNGPGPGYCGRVSCSYNAAIYWCNDVSWARDQRSLKSFSPNDKSTQLVLTMQSCRVEHDS